MPSFDIAVHEIEVGIAMNDIADKDKWGRSNRFAQCPDDAEIEDQGYFIMEDQIFGRLDGGELPATGMDDDEFRFPDFIAG